MVYKTTLLSIYETASNDSTPFPKIPSNELDNIKILSENCFSQKGVYTVFVTLAIYKIHHPTQDIRNHQTQIPNGFSARTIDTQYITPTLKALGLPSMAESGWLTRSLEQPFPYSLDYNGKISNKKVKQAFLELIDSIETKKANPKAILIELLSQIITLQKANIVVIQPLKSPEKLTISKLIEILDKHFSFNYQSFGGSKLPVIAFYAIYQIIIEEVSRYSDCTLKPIGSHTASDRTSKSAGDIEIFEGEFLFEAVEIKLNKAIDANILRIAKEKIIRYNPTRYYILSYSDTNENEIGKINTIIDDVKVNHGCQIVINGIIPTLKYYLRLISNLNDFLNNYSYLVQHDSELKAVHKHKWNELMLELQQ
ncbi:MAG: hypothetical protein GQ569_03460 [Methylococcaceae bacterium]|nr:hypothetical protein [Methylococcaceae bacterium]